jgi:hypothetical protein
MLLEGGNKVNSFALYKYCSSHVNADKYKGEILSLIWLFLYVSTILCQQQLTTTIFLLAMFTETYQSR